MTATATAMATTTHSSRFHSTARREKAAVHAHSSPAAMAQ